MHRATFQRARPSRQKRGSEWIKREEGAKQTMQAAEEMTGSVIHGRTVIGNNERRCVGV